MTDTRRSTGAPSTIGSYTILGELGRGGMGTVYRARDNRLRRDVALKVLPEDFQLAPARQGRFEQEARVVAALSHPNIAAIYGIEHTAAGSPVLVLELVEGKTLAARIAQGRVPVEEALTIARQIAQALDAAHEKGVVHRDLKPANIVITPGGLVKVLDFGIAKIAEPEQLATEETVTAGFTHEGTVVGTPAYMSPEQATGQIVDRRTDIWAFGCVLFEMLTGRRAFDGSTSTETLAAVLNATPDWSALPPQVPATVVAVLKRCFDRERVKRLGDVAAIRFALEDVPAAVDQPHTVKRGVLLAAAVITLIVAATAGFIGWKSRPVAEVLTPGRFPITLPQGQRLAGLDRPSLALSADGRQLAVVATTQGEDERQIYVYSMDTGEFQSIPGTEKASNPFFSPDGKRLGFFGSDLALTTVPVTGGVVRRLATATNPLGASWSRERTIAFTPLLSVIHQLPEEGGTPQPLTRFPNGETQHIWPAYLPDGKGLLFAAGGSISDKGNPAIAVQAMGSGERENLRGLFGIMPQYLSSGHVVYALDGNVMAVPFDLGRLKVKEGAVAIPVIKGVARQERAAQFSVSASGALAYAPGPVQTEKYRFVWVSRDGTELETLNAPARFYTQARISPDGQRIVTDEIEGGEIQLRLYDIKRDQLTQLTYPQQLRNHHGVWLDPQRILFMSGRNGQTQLFSQLVDGGAAAQQITAFPATPEADILPIPYSICGNTLTFTRLFPTTAEAWTLSLGDTTRGAARSGTQQLSLQLVADGALQLSPDCDFVAYASDESGSGHREIIVRDFPGLSKKWHISADGGNEPMWNPNPHKRELFYRIGDSMIAVDINEDGSPAGKGRTLFTKPYEKTLNAYVRANYDVSPDGERFLMLKAAEPPPRLTQITFVQNWIEELKRLVPTN